MMTAKDLQLWLTPKCSALTHEKSRSRGTTLLSSLVGKHQCEAVFLPATVHHKPPQTQGLGHCSVSIGVVR